MGSSEPTEEDVWVEIVKIETQDLKKKKNKEIQYYKVKF